MTLHRIVWSLLRNKMKLLHDLWLSGKFLKGSYLLKYTLGILVSMKMFFKENIFLENVFIENKVDFWLISHVWLLSKKYFLVLSLWIKCIFEIISYFYQKKITSEIEKIFLKKQTWNLFFHIKNCKMKLEESFRKYFSSFLKGSHFS